MRSPRNCKETRKAVQLMQERMSGAKIPSGRTVFDVELIERDSVQQLRER